MMSQTQSNLNLHVDIQDLNKYYHRQDDTPMHALKDIQLKIAAGQIFGIIGRSGAGKSSLLRTLNGLESISSGQIHVLGQDLAQLNHDQLTEFRKRIGMIFQHFNLMSAKTVRENVALPLKISGVAASDIARRVDETLALVGLANKADHYPSQLSGGQKQRVGIARALINQPEILLCDEATSALDPESTQSILTLLKEINQKLGLTIILITHEMQVIRDICDEVVVIDHGEIVERGTVWHVFSQPSQEITKELLDLGHHNLPAGIHAQRNDQHQHQVISIYYVHALQDAFNLQQLLKPLRAYTLLQSRVDEIQNHCIGELLILSSIEESGITAPTDPALLSVRIKEHGYV
ncbi:ATP-binding cassette domain-containing protein [Acinetobacter apis]|uniref:Cell division ATP-binding protein FtsE n=1 Tax=Acinetobacter apis TaxID=1229165 RepID=A0A217EE32_9GAMM|nr:methionine ABC transporter ATP-binding protein [Acinetobacter apis]SNQ28446.1 D-methionine transport system ATP-binding protein [Acinetobacter apis]